MKLGKMCALENSFLLFNFILHNVVSRFSIREIVDTFRLHTLVDYLFRSGKNYWKLMTQYFFRLQYF